MSVTPATRWVLPGLAAATVPLLPHLAPWAIPCIVAAAGLRWLADARPELAPPRALLLAAGGGILVGGFAAHGRAMMGPEAVTLVVPLAWLQLVEARSPTAARRAAAVGFLLCATQGLFDPSLIAACGAAAATAILAAGLWGLGAGASAGWGRALGTGLRLTGMAIPPAALLFVLVPRPAEGFSLPGLVRSAETGLREALQPGTIARLARNESVVLRATFPESRPPRPWYWRAIVLWRCRGLRWERGSTDRLPEARRRSGGVLQQCIYRPQGMRWLVALDRPQAAPTGAELTPGRTLAADGPLRGRHAYRVRSARDEAAGSLSPATRRAALRTPDDLPQRVGSLAREWRSGSADGAAIARRGLAYFADNDFAYTAEPGTMDLATFLFDRRAGFCEHYASTYALLMRLAGVPARVVVGYRGGRWNPFAGHAVIRQAQAHAWCELWLPETGWQRVDPSVAVRLERTGPAWPRGERGAGVETLAGGNGNGNGDDGTGGGDPIPLSETSWESGYRLWLDAITGWWERAVLAYGPRQQERLLAFLGLREWGAGALWTLAALALGACAALYAGIGRMRRGTGDPVLRALAAFERRLRRAGLVRAPHEPPHAFGRRASAALPERAPTIAAFVNLYGALRYGGEPVSRPALRRLRRLARMRGSGSRA